MFVNCLSLVRGYRMLNNFLGCLKPFPGIHQLCFRVKPRIILNCCSFQLCIGLGTFIVTFCTWTLMDLSDTFLSHSMESPEHVGRSSVIFDDSHSLSCFLQPTDFHLMVFPTRHFNFKMPYIDAIMFREWCVVTSYNSNTPQQTPISMWGTIKWTDLRRVFSHRQRRALRSSRKQFP